MEGTDLRRRDLGRALPCLSEQEVEEVSAQLGYVPGNLTRVAARADGLSYVEGNPVTVVELYPLTAPSAARRRKGKEAELEPFPTTYWLTCPHLKEQVGSTGGGWVVGWPGGGVVAVSIAPLLTHTRPLLAHTRPLLAHPRWRLAVNRYRGWRTPGGWLG